MTPETMHDEMRAALAAEALGALDGEERTLLHAHLAACQACRAELADLRASAGALAFAAPPAPLDTARSGRVRARLLARAAADRAPAGDGLSDSTRVAPAPPAPSPSVTTKTADDDDVTRVTPITAAPSRRRGTMLPWLAAAASLVLLLGTGVYALSLRGRVLTQTAWMNAAEEEQNRLERALREREATLAAVSAPAVRVIDMASAGRPEPGGRMFWDQRTHRWTFFAHDLPAIQRGREYQLWLITPGGRKLPAPTFRPGPRGEARVEATYALPADSLQAIAVTEEPAGGLPAPSGPVVIVGAMSSR
ncbi:MAG TPA: anti-sigma factor [Longimicrobium sp.]